MSNLSYHIRTCGLWSTIWNRIMILWGKVCNVISWVPIIWNDEDFDWSYTYRIMEVKFRRLADCMENGHCLHGYKYAKEVRIAAALCKRITDDRYLFSEPPIGPWHHVSPIHVQSGQYFAFPFISYPREVTVKEYRRRWYEEYMLNQDLEYLHRYLTKKVHCWWD